MNQPNFSPGDMVRFRDSASELQFNVSRVSLEEFPAFRKPQEVVKLKGPYRSFSIRAVHLEKVDPKNE